VKKQPSSLDVSGPP